MLGLRKRRDVCANNDEEKANREFPVGKRSRCMFKVMKEDSIVDVSDPTASSTLSKKGRAAIRKLIEAMDLLCSVYDVDFQNLERKHDTGFGKNLNEKAAFFCPTHCTTLIGIKTMKMRSSICLVRAI